MQDNPRPTTVPNKPPFPPGSELIRCAKCDAENLAGASKCHHCEAHLYRICPSCGRSNVRTRRHCIVCSCKLGRTPMQKMRDNLFRGSGPIKLGIAVVVLVVLTVLAIKLMKDSSKPDRERATTSKPTETVAKTNATPATAKP